MDTIRSYAFCHITTNQFQKNVTFEKKCEIVEISIVACSFNHFLKLSPENLPRVLNKINLCVNPLRRIDNYTVQITGNFITSNINLYYSMVYKKFIIEHFEYKYHSGQVNKSTIKSKHF